MPHFQNPWMDTSARDSSGTVSCPLSPFLSSCSSPSCSPVAIRAPAPFLYPCTVLLLILGLYDIALGLMARADRVPHSLAALLCRARTRLPLGHDKACGTENFLPQPSQSVGRFKGTMPYRKRKLSWNYSHNNSVPLRRCGIAFSHAPCYVDLQRRFSPDQSASSFCLKLNALSASSLCFRL